MLRKDIEVSIVRLLEEEKVLDIIERVTNDAIEKKKHKGTIQKSLIYEISLLEPAESKTEKHSRFIPFDEDDAKQLVKRGMPLFNGTCSDCGAMCFDDDTYCSECGAILDEE